MAVSVLNFSMSLDGYIAGPNDTPENPGGDGFERLHEWFYTPEGVFCRPSGPAGEVVDEEQGAAALLTGRRSALQAGHWGGDVNGSPIFVLSQHPPDASVARYPLVTYVTDGIERAMALAKAAAGDGRVTVHGARTAQLALEAGVVDEMQVNVIPVLFGGGRRLFDTLPSRVELEVTRVIDTPKATLLRYRVRR